MTDDRLRRFLLRVAAAAAAVALLYVALRYLLVWLLPFFLAAGCAALMEPAVRWMQTRLRFRRGFAALTATLFLLFLLGGLLSLLGTTLLREARALLEGAPALLGAVPDALDALLSRLERYSAACPPWLRQTVEDALIRYAAKAGSLLETLADRLLASLASLAAALPRVFLAAATAVLATCFTSASLPELRAMARRHIPAETLRRLRGGVTRSLSRWLRAEATLCAVTFAELLMGLLLLRQPYALLLALLVTLVDALPVFGTGTVLLPWAAVTLLGQNVPKAVALAALYLVTLTVRSVLEPRLLGRQAGLPPVASLLAMYLGFCAFGVAGMVVCPFLLLCARLREAE